MADLLESRPSLDPRLAEEWPDPPGISPAAWQVMSARARVDWLIDQTYTETADGWLRTGTTRTADLVEQAVTTEAGARMLLEPLRSASDADSARPAGASGRPPISAILTILAFVFFVVVLVALATDLFGTAEDGSGTQADTTSAETDATSAQAGAADASSTELTDLTGTTWRFSWTRGEERAMYDFVFGPDSTFHELNAEHNSGVYTVDGSNVVLDLTRVATGKATHAGDVRTEQISWRESFAMTWDGETMTGTWTVEDWLFTYEDGLIRNGLSPAEDGIVARLQQ